MVWLWAQLEVKRKLIHFLRGFLSYSDITFWLIRFRKDAALGRYDVIFTYYLSLGRWFLRDFSDLRSSWILIFHLPRKFWNHTIFTECVGDAECLRWSEFIVDSTAGRCNRISRLIMPIFIFNFQVLSPFKVFLANDSKKSLFLLNFGQNWKRSSFFINISCATWVASQSFVSNQYEPYAASTAHPVLF